MGGALCGILLNTHHTHHLQTERTEEEQEGCRIGDGVKECKWRTVREGDGDRKRKKGKQQKKKTSQVRTRH